MAQTSPLYSSGAVFGKENCHTKLNKTCSCFSGNVCVVLMELEAGARPSSCWGGSMEGGNLSEEVTFHLDLKSDFFQAKSES